MSSYDVVSVVHMIQNMPGDQITLLVICWLVVGYVFGQATCICQRLWDPSLYRPTLRLSDLYGGRIYLSLLGPFCIWTLIFCNLFEIHRLLKWVALLIINILSRIPGVKKLITKLPSGDTVLIK